MGDWGDKPFRGRHGEKGDKPFSSDTRRRGRQTFQVRQWEIGETNLSGGGTGKRETNLLVQTQEEGGDKPFRGRHGEKGDKPFSSDTRRRGRQTFQGEARGKGRQTF